MKSLEAKSYNTTNGVYQRFDSVNVLVHDGVYGVHTGAGTSNHRFLKTLVKLGLGPKLNVIPIFTAPSNPNFQQDFFLETLNFISTNKGVVIPIDNGTEGMETFGYFEHWEMACKNAVQIVRELCIANGTHLLVSFDTPFILLHELLGDSSLKEQFFHAHVPHSTGLIHDPDYRMRIETERTAFVDITSSPSGALGSTCDYMKKHLLQDYGADERRIIPLTYGTLTEDYHRINQSRIEQTVRALGIEEGEKFVLAYGRAMPYKGFHIFLESLAKLRESSVKFVLIAAARDGGNDYIDSLQKIMDDYGLRGKLITHFDSTLPYILQQSHQLAAVVVPSLAEPFGLIPVENFANPFSTAPVIASAVGGLGEQIEDGVNGFTFEAGNADDLAKKIQIILQMDDTNRKAIKKTAFDRARERNDLEKNVSTFFSHILRFCLRL
jgi:glycosyltransferase involved in cell wall biosynthesis